MSKTPLDEMKIPKPIGEAQEHILNLLHLIPKICKNFNSDFIDSQ